MWYLEKYNPLLAGSIDGTDTLPHDHGIVRALNSYYTIKKPVISTLSSNSLKTIFVGRLPEDVNEDDIKKSFSKYGKIKSARVVLDIVTGISRGYGFVEFDSEKDCQRAYNNGDNMFLNGHKILIDYERARVMRDWIPRRLGGGFGGKKESGQLRFGSIDRPFKEPLNIGENQKMPDIRKNQKYSDCWRDYIYEEKKKEKSDKHEKEEKERRDIKEYKDNRHHKSHSSRDRSISKDRKRHKSHSRHSSKEKERTRTSDWSSFNDGDHHRSHSRSSHSKSSRKRHRDEKEEDISETIKRNRTDHTHLVDNKSSDDKNSTYEKSSRSKSRHSHHHHHSHHHSHDRQH